MFVYMILTCKSPTSFQRHLNETARINLEHNWNYPAKLTAPLDDHLTLPPGTNLDQGRASGLCVLHPKRSQRTPHPRTHEM